MPVRPPLLPVLLAALAVESLFAPDLRGADPAREDRVESQASGFTHVLASESDYYTTQPQQARPADGSLPVGTKVRLVRKAGSYSRVHTESGVEVFP